MASLDGKGAVGRLALGVGKEARTEQHCLLRPACSISQPSHCLWVRQNLSNQCQCPAKWQSPELQGHGQAAHTKSWGGREDTEAPPWPTSQATRALPQSQGACSQLNSVTQNQAQPGLTRPPVPISHKGLPSTSPPPLDTQHVTCQCHPGKRPRNLSGKHGKRQGNMTKMTHK